MCVCECIHCRDQALFLYVFSYVYVYQLHISASKEVEGGNQAHFPFESRAEADSSGFTQAVVQPFPGRCS